MIQTLLVFLVVVGAAVWLLRCVLFKKGCGGCDPSGCDGCAAKPPEDRGPHA